MRRKLKNTYLAISVIAAVLLFYFVVEGIKDPVAFRHMLTDSLYRFVDITTVVSNYLQPKF